MTNSDAREKVNEKPLYFMVPWKKSSGEYQETKLNTSADSKLLGPIVSGYHHFGNF